MACAGADFGMHGDGGARLPDGCRAGREPALLDRAYPLVGGTQFDDSCFVAGRLGPGERPVVRVHAGEQVGG
jgi:hypothetical protein